MADREFLETVQGRARVRAPLRRSRSDGVPASLRRPPSVIKQVKEPSAVDVFGNITPTYPTLPSAAKKVFQSYSFIFLAANGVVNGDQIFGDYTVPAGYYFLGREITLFDLSGGILTTEAPVIGLTVRGNNSAIEGMTKIPMGVTDSLSVYALINQYEEVRIVVDLPEGFGTSPIPLTGDAKLGLRFEGDLIPIKQG